MSAMPIKRILLTAAFLTWAVFATTFLSGASYVWVWSRRALSKGWLD